MNGWADNLSEDERGQNKGLIEGGKTNTHQANIEQNGEKGERDCILQVLSYRGRYLVPAN